MDRAWLVPIAVVVALSAPAPAAATDDPAPTPYDSQSSPSPSSSPEGPVSGAREQAPLWTPTPSAILPGTPSPAIGWVRPQVPTPEPTEITIQLLPPPPPAQVTTTTFPLRIQTPSFTSDVIAFLVPGVAFVAAWELSGRRWTLLAAKTLWRRRSRRVRFWGT